MPKASKSSVDYSTADGHADRCGVCTYFRLAVPKSESSCTKVAGAVHPDYWCKLFESRRSERKGSPARLTPFYFIRHGATALNEGQGAPERDRSWMDIPLSDEGQEEADALADKLRSSGITVLAHSDLSRATQTAEAIARTTGARLVPMPALRTWNLGELTGNLESETNPIRQDYARKRPFSRIPGGESFYQFKKRALMGVAEALSYDDEGLVGIVSHHGVERLILAWIELDCPKSLLVDCDTLFEPGEAPANAERMELPLANLPTPTNQPQSLQSLVQSSASAR